MYKNLIFFYLFVISLSNQLNSSFFYLKKFNCNVMYLSCNGNTKDVSMACYLKRLFSVLSLPQSIYSTASRDALVTTKPDGLAALRRASHCSSYVALNLLSSLQILRAVPSRHVWFAGGSDLHSPLERLPAFALHCPYIILTQVLRFLSRAN